MKKISSKLFVWLLVLWCSTVFSLAAPAPEAAHGNGMGQVKVELRDYFRALADQGLFSGSVLVAKDGKVILKEGLGIADYETGRVNSPGTAYAIASMSKAFTAMSILMLEERGLLRIEDKVSDYLPDYPDGENISIRQLLNMTAGLDDFFDDPELWAGNFALYHTPEEMYQYFIDETPYFAPGTEWSYCNSCYIVLGSILEQVSGMSYREFLQENILGPLKMNHTSYDPDEVDFMNKRAVGYDNLATLPPPLSIYLHPTVAYTAGGIFSTVTDMYKWDRALYTEQLVSAETMEKIFTPGMGDYGFAWYIDELEVCGQNHKLAWHWGSYLGYHGFIGRMVDDDVFIMILQNTTSPDLLDQNVLRPTVQDVASIIFNND